MVGRANPRHIFILGRIDMYGNTNFTIRTDQKTNIFFGCKDYCPNCAGPELLMLAVAKSNQGAV